MKYRIAMWACAGVLVVCFWQAYVFATAPIPVVANPIVWVLARLSCPILFLSFQFHVGLSIELVLLANAVTYALMGLAFQSFKKLRHLYLRTV